MKKLLFRKSLVKKKLLWIVFSLVLISFGPLFVYADFALKTDASVMAYKNPCDIGLPDHLPSMMEMQFLKAGSYEIHTCQNFAKQYGHSAAVVVTFENQTAVNKDITIKRLSSIRLQSNTGASPAVAMVFYMRSPFGNMAEVQFLTIDDIKVTATVAMGKRAQLIFLFPAAKEGDVIFVGDMAPVTIY